MTRRTTKEPPLITRCAVCGEPPKIRFGMSPQEVVAHITAHREVHELVHKQERQGTVRRVGTSDTGGGIYMQGAGGHTTHDDRAPSIGGAGLGPAFTSPSQSPRPKLALEPASAPLLLD